ncbi:uncharacterized protein LOC122502234 [Leptopilina heterotoma]|uniref:uncharacterized protein LOC122502234 n=1 Tax=Leptopilina heterotoma TaxID=63436 RepID=UPI001CA9F864|nr:uncharacterized protein LOC122502234 [Leptopilina heterotoma]
MFPAQEKPTIKQLIDQQTRNFTTLKRHCNSAKEAVRTTSDITLGALNHRLRLISQIWDLSVNIEEQIQKSKKDEDDPYFIEGKFETAEEYFLKFSDYIMTDVARMEREVKASTIQQQSTPSTSTTCYQSTPLPKITIPKFSAWDRLRSRYENPRASDILVYYVSQMLDTNTRLAWELKLGNSIDYPHFSTLLNFLDSRIRAMEAVEKGDENKIKPVIVQTSNSELCQFSDVAEVAHSNMAAPGALSSHRVLLATAQVILSSSSGRSIKVRALLDQGSIWTLITEELAHALNIVPDRADIRLTGINNVQAGCSQGIAPVTICSSKNKNFLVKSNALILKQITNYVPSADIEILQQPHLQGLDFADDELVNAQPIQILIGADLYGMIMRNGLKKGGNNQPVAQNTIFGWILSGNFGSNNNSNELICFRKSDFAGFCASNSDIGESLQRFWEIEEIPRASKVTLSEQECELYFENTHSREVDGRYKVRYPSKSGTPIDIGNSLQYAEKALLNLRKTLSKSPKIMSQYTDFFVDYEKKGHMSRIDEKPKDESQVVYIPHHPIIRESSSTTKVRGVFNASKKTSNLISLNDHMHIGERLQGNIFKITLLWRTYRFVYVSDIAQMYRQILIDERDRDYQRILWFSTSLSNPIQFRLNTVTYGTTAAPFLDLRVLKQLVKDEGDSFPLASFVLEHQIYIDDCIFGADSKERIKETRDEVISLLAKGKFHLRKWASNCSTLLEDIDLSDHGHAVEKSLIDETSLKILGIVWVPTLDVYRFKINLIENSKITKRSVLSLIARLYDPLGWVSPVIIIAKILIQKMWLKALTWDEPLPQDLSEFWLSYYSDLSNLENLSIPRWTGQGEEVIESSIHGFSDASNTAYAAVVYLRLVFQSGGIQVSLLASRTKLAPTKTLLVPRLELCGALLLSQLVSSIKNVFSFENLPTVYWTDSTIVLAWLRKHSSTWKTFVANRVAAIQSVAPVELWKHVKSEQNPADIGSRGVRASDLIENQLWWKGPTWLSGAEDSWPVDQEMLILGTNLESRDKVCHVGIDSNTWFDILMTKVSSWPKLIRIVSYILKFLVIRLKFVIPGCETAESISMVRFCRESQIVCTHDRGILRVGRRLSNAPLEFERRHPAILKKHSVVEKIVRHYHEKCLHGSTQLTLNLVRQSFWILRSKQVIKSVIYKCVICVRLKASCVCFVTRAIHLEIVYDYSSDSFIATLKRFVGRRGLPSVIYSDNETNFKGAYRELTENFESFIRCRDVQAFLINDRIRWEFIPPAAAHFGGIWESGVRSVKHHLRRILLDRTPHYEELNTLLCQIEMCLNSRPLCPLSDDPSDLRVLTPGHFLIVGEIVAIPENSLLDLKESRLSRWQLWQQLLESFWKIWSQDYLLSLQQRNKWKQKLENLCVNQMVLLKQENLPPTKCQIGRIISVKKGSDNLVRVATIKTASGTYVRPITKLIVLPVKHED